MFYDLHDLQKFESLLMYEDRRILTWLAKFLYNGFNKRNDVDWDSSLFGINRDILKLYYEYLIVLHVYARFSYQRFYM